MNFLKSFYTIDLAVFRNAFRPLTCSHPLKFGGRVERSSRSPYRERGYVQSYRAYLPRGTWDLVSTYTHVISDS